MYVCGRKVEIKKIQKGYGARYEIKYDYCQHTIQWDLDYFSSHEECRYYDLIPRRSSFSDICYNPYEVLKKIKEILAPDAPEPHLLFPKLISFLMKSLEDDQFSKLEFLAKSHRLDLLSISSSYHTLTGPRVAHRLF
jgi:hypothetical protein